jgi:hypothetical protein
MNIYRSFILIKILLFSTIVKSQILRDYCQNGSFEQLYDCNAPVSLRKAKFWSGIDSMSVAGLIAGSCNAQIPIPKNVHAWQFPRHGNNYVVNTLYYPAFPVRGYMRNRLRESLLVGRTYCVRFFINIANTSPRGIDGFGAYFADSTLDTITKCTIPLTYLNPQIKNASGNVISDTLNWVAISGTFVANGTEKYMVIGNFMADNAITTSTINGPYVNEEWTDVCIDDVSCFDVDLPACAGPNKTCIIGDSVFIGSNDPGLDEFCTWYQWPNMSAPIATISGLYVKPITTTTYVVRQQLWCSGVQWDSVVVYHDAVGIDRRIKGHSLKIFPVPAKDQLNISLEEKNAETKIESFEIFDTSGNLVLTDNPSQARFPMQIDIKELKAGIYYLKLNLMGEEKVNKVFVIER